MKYVIKASAPIEFEAWKISKRLTKNDLLSTPNLNKNRASIWKKFTGNRDIKGAVKQSLLAEQGFICCYCQ